MRRMLFETKWTALRLIAMLCLLSAAAAFGAEPLSRPQTETPTAVPTPCVATHYAVHRLTVRRNGCEPEFLPNPTNRANQVEYYVPCKRGDRLDFRLSIEENNGLAVTYHDFRIQEVFKEIMSASSSQATKSSAEAFLTMHIPKRSCSRYFAAVGYTDRDYPTRFVQGYFIEAQIEQPFYAPIEQIVIGQGYGGKTAINIREVNYSLIYKAFNGAYGSFLARIGGGADRSTCVTAGDVNGDNRNDVVVSLGPITEQTDTPNVVVPRDGQTKKEISNDFFAFSREEYGEGEIHTAVGNFTGQAPAQIATAQGLGGHNRIRLFQYTGQARPNGYRAVGEFEGLSGEAWIRNASGGLNVASGDVDGDGLDELLVSQSYSRTSRAVFQVLDIAPDGDVEGRVELAAYPEAYLNEKGAGVGLVVADLDGDEKPEILAASQGPGVSVENKRNVLSVLRPVLADGRLSGFDYVPNGVLTVFSNEDNPSGVIQIAAGEFDACDGNGEEFVVSKGCLIRRDGLRIVPRDRPVNSYYLFYGIKFNDGGALSLRYTPCPGFPGFHDEWIPSSNVITLSAGHFLR